MADNDVHRQHLSGTPPSIPPSPPLSFSFSTLRSFSLCCLHALSFPLGQSAAFLSFRFPSHCTGSSNGAQLPKHKSSIEMPCFFFFGSAKAAHLSSFFLVLSEKCLTIIFQMNQNTDYDFAAWHLFCSEMFIFDSSQVPQVEAVTG